MNDAIVFGLGMLLIYIGGVLQGAFLNHQSHKQEINNIKADHRFELAQLELKHQEKQLETITRYRKEFEKFESLFNAITDRAKEE